MDRSGIRRAIDRPRSERPRVRLGDVSRLFPRRADPRAARDSPSVVPGERRVVVITGASAGVGRAVAHAFAQRGDAIALIARDALALEETAHEVESRGGRALVLPLDVAEADAVEAATARIEAELGPIDIWVNNAMVSVFAPVIETTAEEYRRVTEVTFLGYVHGTLSALRRMRPRNRGVIVQVGSALAYRAIPLQSAYCAAKHAINGFSESLRSELLHDGSHVRVTQVQLPAVNTPQFDWVRSRLPGRAQPMPPIYQPEVVAEGIVWAAEHDRRELVIGLSADLAILADKIAPGLLDRYLGRSGVGGQQTDEPADPDRPDNLYQPVPGGHATRGRFDDRAKSSSAHLWWTTRLGALRTLGIGAAVAGLAALAVRRGR